jgi:hypothetical protein
MARIPFPVLCTCRNSLEKQTMGWTKNSVDVYFGTYLHCQSSRELERGRISCAEVI